MKSRTLTALCDVYKITLAMGQGTVALDLLAARLTRDDFLNHAELKEYLEYGDKIRVERMRSEYMSRVIDLELGKSYDKETNNS